MAVKKAGILGLTNVVDATVHCDQERHLQPPPPRHEQRRRAQPREFLHLALVTMLQSYGMTELCGACAVLPPEYYQYGSVGLIMPSVEIKLRDHPEVDYLLTNNPPQGEVLIRGPSVVKGYHKHDDLNNDRLNIFTKDCWLRTGDEIGRAHV